jgi:hypothetical protein
MSKRTVLSASLLVLLLSAATRASLVQARLADVVPGQWFKYGSINVNWASNDTSASFPDSLVEVNDTLWMRGEIVTVVQPNVTLQMIAHYKNGTEEITGGHINVDTGEGENATMMIISSDLVANDSIYTSGYYSSWRINETVLRTYAFGERDTNHLHMSSGYSGMGANMSYSYNVYWDRLTGLLVEESVAFTNRTGIYLTSWSLSLKMTETDIWVIPEFPSMILLPLFTATTLFVVALSRRRLKQTKLPFS